MPNVTISVPDSLKTEMDEFTEVSWSQICRDAISRYIAERKNPTPKIELDLLRAVLKAKDFHQGYTSLNLSLRIHNKMDFEIIVDRIIFHVDFWKGNTVYAMGNSFDIHKIIINSTSTVNKSTYLNIYKEKIYELEDLFDSTFPCRIRCVVFVEGFKQPYNTELRTRIPIDEWLEVVHETIGVKQ
ncbi:MAG: hypothetical protein ACFFDT_33020 [Candidatus Hodarchaeota archaeon]